MASRKRVATPLSIYVPVGILGYGFPQSSLQAAMEHDLAMIGVDAGSVDPGPYYLGSGRSFTSRTMVKRDLDLLMAAASSKGIPLVVGSAGGAGAAPHLAWTLEIAKEVAKERGIHFRTAAIHSDLDREYLKSKLSRGEILEFEAENDLSVDDIDACTHVVAQMGLEPIMRALSEGANLVIAGRAVDAAIAASLPVLTGCDPGLAIHMGKIVECGSLIAVPREHDGVIGHLYSDHFVIEPADGRKRCTVDLVSAHMLYERTDPYHFEIPGATLDLENARFQQANSRAVRVSGGSFRQVDPYTVKLEGSAVSGYRTVCVAGARDPRFIEQIDDVILRVKQKVRDELRAIVSPDSYTLKFRLYGRDGVMNEREPHPNLAPQELGVVIDVVAHTQEIADSVCALARSATLHMGYDGRLANAGNLAFPYSPAEFQAPEAYEFRIYHLMKVDDPVELFPIEWIDL